MHPVTEITKKWCIIAPMGYGPDVIISLALKVLKEKGLEGEGTIVIHGHCHS